MDPPIYNPTMPYSGPINGGFRPGRMVRLSGTVPLHSQGFVINLICGPNSINADVGLYFNPRFNENLIVCNAKNNAAWGVEERLGPLPIVRSQNFEILILCEPQMYKIAINGKHFTTFNHRVPVERITNIGIEGQVTVSFLQFEGTAGPVAPSVVIPGQYASPVAPYPVQHSIPMVPHAQVYPPPTGIPPQHAQVYPPSVAIPHPPMGIPPTVYHPHAQPGVGIPPYPVQTGFTQAPVPVAGVYPVAGAYAMAPGQLNQAQMLAQYNQEKMMKKAMKKDKKGKEKLDKDAKKMMKKKY